MDLTLLAILYTGLFAIAFQTVRNAGRAGPAGRTTGLPVYQRRTLLAFALLLLCTVVNTYLMTRPPTVPRPPLAGLVWLDLAGLAAIVGATSGVRRQASRASLTLTGWSLACFCLAVTLAWSALAFSWTSPEGAAFLASVSASWGTASSTVGLVALVHYAAAPLLAALAVAARDRWPELPAWKKDHAYRGLAVATSLLALVYLVFTWGVLRG